MFVQTETVTTKSKDFTGLFESLGIMLGERKEGQNESTCDCPFCGKPRHLFINVFTGQWNCKVCTRQGNSFGFMEAMCDLWEYHTEPERWRELQDKRGIPFDAFKSWGCGYNDITGEWLIPVYNDKGTVRDIRRWNGKRLYSTAHTLQLFGTYAISQITPEQKKRVWTCYSDDTEILTEGGFVLFKHLGASERVAQYERGSGKISFVRPKAIQKFWHSGEMVALKGRWSDLLVTPDHRTLSRQAKGEDKVLAAKDIKHQRHFPVAGIYKGSGGPNAAHAKLICAYIADGYKPRGQQIQWNLKKERKKVRLRSLLTELNIPWKERSYRTTKTWTVFIVTEDDAQFLRPFYTKSLPYVAAHWSLDFRERFLSEIRFWDGDGNESHSRFFTANKPMAEIVSVMAALSGWGCTLREDKRKNGGNYILNLHPKTHRYLSEPTKTTYEGEVYCCTVDTGFIVVRRNGKTMISGNCEGEWDAMALRWLLQNCDMDEIVVAVPGAGTFKSEWAGWFQDCHVIFCYDNDQAGDDGSHRAAEALASVTKSQRFLCWPEAQKGGWDIRDQIAKGIADSLPPAKILRAILDLIQKQHRRDKPVGNLSPEDGAPEQNNTPATFQEVLAVFEKWTGKVEADFRDALIVALSVVIANRLPGRPIWVYLVGASGSGKTLILCALAACEECVFHSSLRAAELVSGFDRRPDPSLIPKLSGKTAIFKEGTELLAMHPDARREVYAILRGAWDGRVDRTYGNGVVRKYENLKFNMLIGVTPAIRADNQATMGERFITIEMKESPAKVAEKIDRIINNADSTDLKQMDFELSDVIRRFLLNPMPKEIPAIPPAIRKRISAMVQLISYFRAGVERDLRDRDMLYRCIIETPTRLAEQFTPLAKAICITLDKLQADEEVCRVLRKIMGDSSVGFHVDIAKALIRNKNVGMTPEEISVTARMSPSLTGKKLADMMALDILQLETRTIKETGFKVVKYRLTNRIMKLWDASLGRVFSGEEHSAGDGI
jgi:hypothetical protein